MTVSTTTNYSRFSFAPGNRPVPERLTELAHSVDEINLLSYFPIVVCRYQGKLYILDGQHRFTLCRDRKIPVTFIIAPLKPDSIPSVAATITVSYTHLTLPTNREV